MILCLLECKPYNSQDKNYDGVIPIKIRTLTPIHLSFGEYSIDKQNRILSHLLELMIA